MSGPFLAMFPPSAVWPVRCATRPPPQAGTPGADVSSLDVEIPPVFYSDGSLDVKRYARAMASATQPASASGAVSAGTGQPGSDEVDEIVARWQSERPDLDVSPLQVLSRVSRLARHLDRARRAAFAAHGLEIWEFDVLSALRRQGPPYQLSPGALLRATLVTSGTMTNRIDRLTAKGLVSRRPDPQDKRGVLVQLTEAGLRTVDDAFAELLAGEEALLTALNSGQQDQLAGLLRTLLIPFDVTP
jgi:DNA-binding MarR family transcriptional regulator